MRLVPVFVICHRPRELDAHRVIPADFRHVIARHREDHADKDKHDPPDIKRGTQRVAVAEHHHQNSRCRDHEQHDVFDFSMIVLHLMIRRAAHQQADPMQRQQDQRHAEYRKRLARPAVRLIAEIEMRGDGIGQPIPEHDAHQRLHQDNRAGDDKQHFMLPPEIGNILFHRYSPLSWDSQSMTSSTTEVFSS